MQNFLVIELIMCKHGSTIAPCRISELNLGAKQVSKIKSIKLSYN